LTRTVLLSIAFAAVLSAGQLSCGGDNDSDDPKGGYAGAVEEQTDRVLAVGDELPEAGEAGKPEVVKELDQLANGVTTAETEIRKLTPPPAVLETHQFLLDAVAFVELDLRDLQAATDPGSATSALDEVQRHLELVESYSKRIVEKASA
jgi:hypothetical protein